MGRGCRWIAVLWILLSSGCGYRLSGGMDLPGGVKTLSVEVLYNRTAETGIETVFTHDLIQEFSRTTSVRLTQSETADAVLSGTLQKVRTETVSHRGQVTPAERRIEAFLSLKLSRSDGTVLWEATELSDSEAYDVVPDKYGTEQNRRDALAALSQRMAENVIYQMIERF